MSSKMNGRFSDPSDPQAVEQAAAEWAIRHDRGLTAAEQDEFHAWLAADRRHSMTWAEHQWGWEELDRLAGLQTSWHAVPDPDLLRPSWRRAKWRWKLFLSAAAVAAVSLLLWLVGRTPEIRNPHPLAPSKTEVFALIEERTLSDGSVVSLNHGASLTEDFSAEVRRVNLNQGEASFQVMHDSSRPFLVDAKGVVVRAVGTVFNVRLESDSLEVLVTEGKVSVAPLAIAADTPAPLVGVNERAVVSLKAGTPELQITTMGSAEIEARLAWQPRWFDFTNSPLAEIVTEFNQRNVVQMTVEDPELAELRLSATFRSDNVEGFVRLLESNFGVRVAWRGNAQIALSKAK